MSGTRLPLPDLEAPRFARMELKSLRKAFNDALMYVGPVGISEHATTTWREAKHWVDRVDALISETEEWMDENAAREALGA